MRTPQLLAAIITYNPDPAAVAILVNQLRDPRVDICIIDNGSANSAELSALLSSEQDVSLLLQDENLGLAAASNLAISRARQVGAPLVMCLDQDSSIEPGHAGILIDQFTSLCAQESRIGAIGARVYDLQRKRLETFRRFRWPGPKASSELPPGFHQADFLISSGTLLNLECLDEVGGMNEAMFIDSVDMEWCFRATAAGWVLVGTEHPVIRQQIGTEVLSFAGFSTKIREHNPERYFTMTRNRRYLYTRSYTPWGWRLRDFPRALFKFFALLLMSPRRREVLSAHWRGLVSPLPHPGTEGRPT